MIVAKLASEYRGEFHVCLTREGFPLLYLHKDGKISTRYYRNGSSDLTRMRSRREAIALLKKFLRVKKKVPSVDNWMVKVKIHKSPFVWTMDLMDTSIENVADAFNATVLATKKAYKCLKQISAKST